jgi:hypothetical protein
MAATAVPFHDHTKQRSPSLKIIARIVIVNGNDNIVPYISTSSRAKWHFIGRIAQKELEYLVILPSYAAQT